LSINGTYTIEIAVSEKRKADRILFVEKAESRFEIAKFVGMSGIKRDIEAVACKGFVVIETDGNVIDVVSLVLGFSAVGVDAPPHAGIPLAAFDEEIHPRWPLSKIKAEKDEPWIHNELVRVGPRLLAAS